MSLEIRPPNSAFKNLSTTYENLHNNNTIPTFPSSSSIQTSQETKSTGTDNSFLGKIKQCWNNFLTWIKTHLLCCIFKTDESDSTKEKNATDEKKSGNESKEDSKKSGSNKQKKERIGDNKIDDRHPIQKLALTKFPDVQIPVVPGATYPDLSISTLAPVNCDEKIAISFQNIQVLHFEFNLTSPHIVTVNIPTEMQHPSQFIGGNQERFNQLSSFLFDLFSHNPEYRLIFGDENERARHSLEALFLGSPRHPGPFMEDADGYVVLRRNTQTTSRQSTPSNPEPIDAKSPTSNTNPAQATFKLILPPPSQMAIGSLSTPNAPGGPEGDTYSYPDVTTNTNLGLNGEDIFFQGKRIATCICNQPTQEESSRAKHSITIMTDDTSWDDNKDLFTSGTNKAEPTQPTPFFQLTNFFKALVSINPGSDWTVHGDYEGNVRMWLKQIK